MRVLRLSLVLGVIWLFGALAILQYGRSQANGGISPSEVAGELFQIFCIFYGLLALFVIGWFLSHWMAEPKEKGY